jgi:hypothetical protein
MVAGPPGQSAGPLGRWAEVAPIVRRMVVTLLALGTLAPDVVPQQGDVAQDLVRNYQAPPSKLSINYRRMLSPNATRRCECTASSIRGPHAILVGSPQAIEHVSRALAAPTLTSGFALAYGLTIGRMADQLILTNRKFRHTCA